MHFSLASDTLDCKILPHEGTKKHSAIEQEPPNFFIVLNKILKRCLTDHSISDKFKIEASSLKRALKYKIQQFPEMFNPSYLLPSYYSV